MNELAKLIIEDGQETRPIMNYLDSTFNDIKGKKLSFHQTGFHDKSVFLNHIRDTVIPLMLEIQKELINEN